VKEVDGDGTAEMTQTLDRIRFVAEGAAIGKTEFDTADPKDPEGPLGRLAPAFRSMVNAPIALKMGARGQISDVRIPAKMTEALKGLGANTPGLADFLSEKSLQNLISQGTVPLPEGALAKGDAWTASRKVEMPFGLMTVDSTYTYDGKAGPLEKFAIKAKVDLKPKADAPVEIKLDSQDSEGSFTFDPDAGALRSSATVLKMKMLLGVMDKQLVQEVVSSVTMESKPAKSPKSSQ
jgi:hypothetical protein